MGIPDKRLKISDAQAVTTTDVSDNSLDLGAADKELGINEIVLSARVSTAFTGLDSGLIIHIIDGSSVDSNGEIDAGERELCSTGTLAQALFLTAGLHIQLKVPPRKLQRYLAVRYEPVSQAGVAGKFTSYFMTNSESDVTS